MVISAPGIQQLAPSALLCWTVLFAPLIAGAFILLFGIHKPKLASWLAIAGLLTAFVSTVILFLSAQSGHLTLPYETSVSWIALADLKLPFGILIDQYSLLMTLVVTGVGGAIFIYAVGYMENDPAYSRFFGVLSLFAFSMLTIVLANNWIQLFMGWELVGFSSYLLIGHWYAKPSAADAGKKAFMVNRVADFGFMLGIFALWAISNPDPSLRTFNFLELEHTLHSVVPPGSVSAAFLPLVGLLLFCGPLGKSAQFPLHVWLPDAMEGPTPVSALIHAATMVAAGVYMLCRTFWLFAGLALPMTVILWVGAATAFLAASLALAENDLKRILAYSTLSQLGYMVMAVGLGGQAAAMYHLTTHAFFKALLFLAAGSVIHGTHEQDIWRLGGLWHSMRWTSVTFLIGALALCGIWPFSGFFSKEEILLLAQSKHLGVYVLGTFTAGITAFYTARCWFVAFAGKRPAGPAHGHDKAHADHGGIHARPGDSEGRAGESPPIMLIPLFFLAGLSIIAGFIGIPRFLPEHAHEQAGSPALVSVASTVVVFTGIFLAWLIYKKKAVSAEQIVHALALPYSFVKNGYYFNEVYNWYVSNIQQKIIARSCEWIEQHIIIGLIVNGMAWLTGTFGRMIRLLQTGKVQTYALAFLLGVIWLLSTGLPR